MAGRPAHLAVLFVLQGQEREHGMPCLMRLESLVVLQFVLFYKYHTGSWQTQACGCHVSHWRMAEMCQGSCHLEWPSSLLLSGQHPAAPYKDTSHTSCLSESTEQTRKLRPRQICTGSSLESQEKTCKHLACSALLFTILYLN